VVEYCILITNTGSATATSVVATDALPARFTYAPGTLRTGGNCASATTVEDDDASGADESDPHGASIAGSNVTITTGSLAAGAAFAVKFRGTLN